MNMQEMAADLAAADWLGGAAGDLTTDLPSRFATLLRLLVNVIDNPTEKSRERLRAARTLKPCLASLQAVLESEQTSAELRKDIVEVLRAYRRS
jgi:hypothetical protein